MKQDMKRELQSEMMKYGKLYKLKICLMNSEVNWGASMFSL